MFFHQTKSHGGPQYVKQIKHHFIREGLVCKFKFIIVTKSISENNKVVLIQQFGVICDKVNFQCVCIYTHVYVVII